jgi:tetratricopeptide (TPR) repeat protein
MPSVIAAGITTSTGVNCAAVTPVTGVSHLYQVTYDQNLWAGNGAFMTGDYGAAIAYYQNAINTYNNLPLNQQPAALLPTAYFLLAQANFASGNYGGAWTALSTALQMAPNWPYDPVFVPSELYPAGAAPNYQAQLAALEAAVAANPRMWILQFLLAYQYWFNGDAGRAQAWPIFNALGALPGNPVEYLLSAFAS